MIRNSNVILEENHNLTRKRDADRTEIHQVNLDNVRFLFLMSIRLSV